MTSEYRLNIAPFLNLILLLLLLVGGNVYAGKPVKNPPQTNSAPVIAYIDDITIEIDQNVNLTVDANDAEDDMLKFSLINQPHWLNIHKRNGTLSGSPSLGDSSITQSVQVIVSDGQLETTSNTFSISNTQPPQPSQQVACLLNDGSCLSTLYLNDGATLSYYSNYAVAAGRAGINRAIIMIHGANRNASDYYNTSVESATMAGMQENVLLITPHFKTVDDVAEANELQWSSGGGWKVGSKSVEKSGLNRISSFSALDQMILQLMDRSLFPDMTDIIITGHSAGGQFTQRYAASTQVDLSNSEYLFRFIPANAGSYMYLDEFRVDAYDNSLFTIPETTCAYNVYKYGLLNRYSYLMQLTEQQIRDNYAARDVLYLLGDQDIYVDAYLDTGCEAAFQGQNRLQRGQTLYRYMRQNYDAQNHNMVVVPGVGHSRTAIYTSENALAILFALNDQDFDGVADSLDNCINIANSDQQDINDDYIGDACE